MDWKTYRMENLKFTRVYRDEDGNTWYFEMVGYNQQGQELARGYTMEQYLANKAKRQQKECVAKE